MQTKTLVLCGLLAIIVILSSSEGKRSAAGEGYNSVSDENDDSKSDEQRVRMLLEDDENADEGLQKRANNGTCIQCGSRKKKCCQPNVCKKNRFGSKKCMRVN